MGDSLQRSPGRLLIDSVALFFLASLASAEVVIESFPHDSALARAGVEPEDVLEAWKPNVDGADPIALKTPFTFETLCLEQVPRGTVELHGKRHDQPVSFAVEPGECQAQVRPAMTGEERRLYTTVRRQVAAGRFEEALASVGQAVHAGRGSGAWELECWWWLRTGELLAGARAFDSAHTAYQNAEKAARDKSARAAVGFAIGQLGKDEKDLEAAEAAYRAVLALYGEGNAASLVAARSHTRLGNLAWIRGELGKMAEHHLQALIVTESAAPRSYIHGRCLNHAGHVAYLQGDLEAAESYLTRARSLLAELAPLSNEFGTTLYVLGLIERSRSRLTAAERYLRKALDIAEAQASPGQDLMVAYRYRGIGELKRMQGDLALAEDYLRRALSVAEIAGPSSWQLARILASLADILDDSGRDASAERYYRRALAIVEDLDNEFLSAHVQGNLATMLAERGQLEEAKNHFQRTLEIYRELTPRSSSIPWALVQLGLVAMERSDLSRAEAYFHQALAFLEGQAPHHIFLAICLNNLGDLARRRGRLADAERFYRRALDIYGVAKAAIFEEKVRHGLGLTLGRRGMLGSAAAELERAVAVLEEQLRHLGGSRQSQGRFRAQHREIYHDALAAELATGHPERAFHLLERSRARSLLAMLAERDLDFTVDLPAELTAARRDLERRWRDATDEALAAADEAVLLEKSDELARLREEQESFEARLRRASPRFAALRYPAPHGVAQVRASLDPGTVLLAYNVAAERTHLFIVTPEDGLVDVVTLPIKAPELRQQVADYRDLLTKRRDPHSPFFRSLVQAGRELYDLLIAPAAPAIEGGVRLLIVPDGALHRLPFAALVRPTDDYLVAWRPLHTVLSATLYAQLRGERPTDRHAADRRPKPIKIAAFGDPLYPSWLREGAEAISEPRLRSVVRGGLFSWQSLPRSRREIEGIAELFPRKDVLLHVGSKATEEAVRSLEPGVDLVHFAVHGHLDDRFPLNSALAMTMPEKLDGDRHNGLLQAWEIFDSVRLNADLVVLSACATALGQEQGGEGLVGLVQAFHYAGARSLTASLWNVSDRATAELMIRFHRHLRAGLAKDEALRAAQLELLRGPIEVADGAAGRNVEDVTAPYFWAAFQIFGDR